MNVQFFLLFTCVAVTPVASDLTGCVGQATYPCLPGMDAIGIGYDAVLGTSFGVGRPIVNLNFSEGNAKVWTDPFGNKTTYSYANQATVTQSTNQATSSSIFRSVDEFISYQQANANADASIGMFFKASVDTKWASTTMADGLHIVAISTSELGIYTITLDPPMFLEAHPQFAAAIEYLPQQYDPAAYTQFIKYYGTHYVAAGTLGGRATMKTVVSHDYYSTQSDSSISAQLHATWNNRGGGGGGGASSNTTDQKWENDSKSSTYTEGGDPSIHSFSSAEEWKAWALSVETSSPVVTSVSLEPLWALIADDLKQGNLKKAISDYASNESFPSPAASTLSLDWCDCEIIASHIISDPSKTYPAPAHPTCHNFWAYAGECPQGKTMVGMQVGDNKGGMDGCQDENGDGLAWKCCRPCFTSNN